MTQWFRGQIEGHYVGIGSGKASVSQYGEAARYKIHVYRALVRDIQVLDSAAPTVGEEEVPVSQPALDLPEDCFYQAQIDDTRLIGIRPKSCFEGTIYDVAISGLRVTHSTKKGSKTYGRLEGEVYGRYRLPPDADPEVAEHLIEELKRKGQGAHSGDLDALVREQVLVAQDDAREMEALHPPSAPDAQDERAKVASPLPVPLLVFVMALVLGLGVGSEPAFLWLGLFIPLLFVRVILGGLFKSTPGQKLFSAVLVVVQFGCLAMLLLDWWSTGCKSIIPWAISGVGAAAIIASVLPSPMAMLCTGGQVALLLFLWYGSWGRVCESKEIMAEPQAIETLSPSVEAPRHPRTNDDGSWPRRPPGGPL